MQQKTKKRHLHLSKVKQWHDVSKQELRRDNPKTTYILYQNPPSWGPLGALLRYQGAVTQKRAIGVGSRRMDS